MNLKVLKRLSHYLKNYKGKFVISVLAAFLGALFTVIAPRLLGDVTTVLYAGITDHVWFIENLPDGTVNPASVWVQGPFMAIGKVQAVIWLVIALIVMYVLSFLFNSMANRMMARIASDVVKDIRSDIDEYLRENRLEFREALATRAEYYRTTEGDYAVRCRVMEHTTALIDLTLTVPNETQAKIVSKEWKEKSQDVYAYIIHTLTQPDHIDKLLERDTDSQVI